MDKKVSALDTIPVVDRATDLLYIVDTSAGTPNKVTTNTLLGLGGNPVGTTDSQVLFNKSLGITNTITASDALFTLQDNLDNTKQAQFQLSGITTGTTRTYTLPNASSTLVDLSTAQTLTNKTLTSPTINTAIINNPTLNVNTISEFTGAAGVTIDGVLIKDNKINGSYITDDTITDTILDYPRWWQEIGRTTLSVAGDTISVTSLPARKYLMLIYNFTPTGGNVSAFIRFNNDSAANYASRYSSNGAADTAVTSQTQMIAAAGSNTLIQTGQFLVINVAAQEKVMAGETDYSATGAASSPSRLEVVGKWANTAAQINRVDLLNTDVGDFAIGSQLIVLGHD